VRMSAPAEETAFFEAQACPACGKAALHPASGARAFRLRQSHGVAGGPGPSFQLSKHGDDRERTDGYAHGSGQILQEIDSVMHRERSDLKPRQDEKAS